MSFWILLTVDLNRGVSEDARDLFNAKMGELGWTKLSPTTTWRGLARNAATEAEALLHAKQHVAKAAAHAKIKSYEVAAQAGTMKPPVWNQNP